jgi:hypothetical protein
VLDVFGSDPFREVIGRRTTAGRPARSKKTPLSGEADQLGAPMELDSLRALCERDLSAAEHKRQIDTFAAGSGR